MHMKKFRYQYLLLAGLLLMVLMTIYTPGETALDVEGCASQVARQEKPDIIRRISQTA